MLEKRDRMHTEFDLAVLKPQMDIRYLLSFTVSR